ncbi:MAG: NAD(+) synthase [Clostridia bacterium]|nr:NAD(+) synthase [Clostridia bacterium]
MSHMSKLIVYGGAFNPLTVAHESAIRALSAHAGEAKLVILPSGAEFIGMWKPGQTVLSDVARVEIIKKFLAEADIENAVMDCMALRENLCTYDALEKLCAAYGADDAAFVLGEDKLEELPRWAHAQELVKKYSFVVVNYDKDGACELNIEGLDAPVRVEYVKLPAGTEAIHATYMRKRMTEHDKFLGFQDTGAYLASCPECVKVAACAPHVYLGNPGKNAEAIIECMKATDGDILVFPELAICGYTVADLLLMPSFIRACEAAAVKVADATAATGQLVYFGCPVMLNNRVYDCAVAAFDGQVQAIIPKTAVANYGAAYEKRWFASANEATADKVLFGGEYVPFGTDILLRAARGGAVVAAEIGEDAWIPMPPSMRHAMAGANVIVNLSADNELVARTEYRRDMLAMLSGRGMCAYAYASCGEGESSTDVVYAGAKLVFVNGKLAEEKTQPLGGLGDVSAAAVVDISMLEADRVHTGTFVMPGAGAGYRFIDYDQLTFRFPEKVSSTPFMPMEDEEERRIRCHQILDLQARGLIQRVRSIGVKKLVIGISGGLDSTLALIVAHNAVRAMGLPDDSIIAITMPGVATSSRTLKNATDLCHQFGTDFRTITIGEACRAHEIDIGHDPESHDVTYENVQARERTQILMDVANMEGGIVVGTGDLSEMALGWCTYNGDHMAHYGVNCDVPKTLVQFIVRSYAMHSATPETRDTLISILDTEITPELVPGGASTEERIGKYSLHDFYLYYYMRYGFDKEKLRLLAAGAFGAWRMDEIDSTLNTFFWRFFTSQFKRSCSPDGVKVGSVAASPRGDLKLPSDMSGNWFIKG